MNKLSERGIGFKILLGYGSTIELESIQMYGRKRKRALHNEMKRRKQQRVQ